MKTMKVSNPNWVRVRDLIEDVADLWPYQDFPEAEREIRRALDEARDLGFPIRNPGGRNRPLNPHRNHRHRRHA